jgi:hypothetical protein
MSAAEPTRPNRYAVYGPGTNEPLVIDAENWVFALGTALELLEREGWVNRMVCEVHPDGTVHALDRVTGASYAVHRIAYGAGSTVSVEREEVAVAAGSARPGPDSRY